MNSTRRQLDAVIVLLLVIVTVVLGALAVQHFNSERAANGAAADSAATAPMCVPQGDIPGGGC